MKFEIKVTDENNHVRYYSITRSEAGETKTLNDFILDALDISEDKRNLPFIIQTPNGSEFYPHIKMKFENNGSPILGDEIESMTIDWR